MKLKIEELKDAIDWMMANTNTATVTLNPSGHWMHLECFDKYDRLVRIELGSSEISMTPKITRAETFNKDVK